MEKQVEPIPEDRPLRDHERNLLRWMLEHGTPEAKSFVRQLDQIRVVSRCPCGCGSIDFAVAGRPPSRGSMNVLADFLFGDDAHMSGAFVFEKSGTLAGLEVYGLAVDAPKDLPRIQDLRPLGE